MNTTTTTTTTDPTTGAPVDPTGPTTPAAPPTTATTPATDDDDDASLEELCTRARAAHKASRDSHRELLAAIAAVDTARTRHDGDAAALGDAIAALDRALAERDPG